MALVGFNATFDTVFTFFPAQQRLKTANTPRIGSIASRQCTVHNSFHIQRSTRAPYANFFFWSTRGGKNSLPIYIHTLSCPHHGLYVHVLSCLIVDICVDTL